MSLPSWLKVVKSPKSWRSNYFVDLIYKDSRYICSHHKTRKLAEQAAQRLFGRYKTARAVHRDYLGWKY